VVQAAYNEFFVEGIQWLEHQQGALMPTACYPPLRAISKCVSSEQTSITVILNFIFST
jgi:hypothetical protein